MAHDADGLDSLFSESISAFAVWVREKRWYGREREGVNAFVMGFLVPRCGPGRVLGSAAQLGVEVAVLQVPGDGRKRVVCKDLVLWSEPFETVWDEALVPRRRPIAILEWKRAVCASEAEKDVAWLRDFSLMSDGLFVGYSVVFNPHVERGIVRVSRVVRGDVEREWLSVP